MRICAPVTSLSEKSTLGGGTFHVKSLQALADRGVQCLIPLAFRLDHEPRENWDVRVFPIRRTFYMGALVSNILFFFAILWLRYLRGEKFDLIRIGDLYHIGPGALLAARIIGVPTVGVIHHVDQGRRKENFVIGWTARRLDRITAPSRSTIGHAVAAFGLDSERLALITEGAATSEAKGITKTAAKAKLGLAGKQVVGFLGGLIPRKNVSLLLDAFAQVAAKHPKAHLLIAGDGPEASTLRSASKHLGLEGRVHLLGRVGPEEKTIAYKAMDLFAFPSKMEGFGLAAADAMAQGIPAIVADRGSLPELVENERTGLVVSIDDPGRLADGISRLLGDSALRKKLGNAAKAHAGKEFTWEKNAEQTEVAFVAAMSGSPDKKLRLGVLLNTGDSLDVMEREGQTERFLGKYLKRWSSAFDQVSVFSYGKDDGSPMANVRFIPKTSDLRGLTYSAILAFRHRIEISRCSVLRVMQAQGALPAVVARWVYGKRFVVTYGYKYGDSMRLKGRWLYGLWLDFLERIVLRSAAAVVVTTQSLSNHVATRTSKKKIHFIANGVDIRRFKPAARKQEEVLRFLYVGRLEAHKNLDMVIQALAPIRHKPVELIVAGQGPMRKVWEELAEELEVPCRFLGSVPHDRLPEIHSQAEVFVLPSRFEGHPKVLIEAFASGLACVGANAPGIVDVIEHGRTGMLADLSVTGFSAQIVRLVDDSQMRRKLGDAARKEALEKYDLDDLLDREIELLRSVADGGRR
jgi:glycosyltransferase involved in cell wall biosynthesis